MKKPEPIVVLQYFTHAIQASLAKSKLDAYGIPCFLTEENLANLYPIADPRFSVRLHVFEKDAELARRILRDESEPLARMQLRSSLPC